MDFEARWRAKWEGRFLEAELSAAIVAVLAILLTLITVVVAATSQDVVVVRAWYVALVAYVVFVLATCVFILDENEMLRAKFFGTFLRMYLNGTYARVADLNGKLMGEYDEAHPGLFGTDVVILVFPIWIGTKMPTTTSALHIHSQDAFDKGEIPVQINTTMFISLTPAVRGLITKIPIFERLLDVTGKCDVQDNLYDPAKPSEHVHEGTRFDEALLAAFQDTILEALRVVAHRYTYQKLNDQLIQYEREVLEYLARPESLFALVGILDLQKGPKFLGAAAIAVDFNVKSLKYDDEMRKQLIAKETARLKALAAKETGKGEGNRLQEIARRTGMSAADVMRNEVLKDVGELDFFVADENAGSILQGFFQRAQKSSRKQKGQKGKQNPPPANNPSIP